MFGKKQAKKIGRRAAPKRIGANGLKMKQELRAQRPRIIRSIIKKSAAIVAFASLAAAVVYVGVVCGPAAYGRVANAAVHARELPQNLRVTGASAHTEKLLRAAIANMLGGSESSAIFDEALIKDVAATIPVIEKISVRKIKDRITSEELTRIRIAERKPVAIVHYGEMALVDRHGICFAPEPGRYYDLPMLITKKLDSEEDVIDMTMFNDIKKITDGLGANYFSQISQIGITDDEHVYLYFKSGEAEYVVGRENLSERLAYVKQLRDRFLSDSGNDVPLRVDVRYRGLAFASER